MTACSGPDETDRCEIRKERGMVSRKRIRLGALLCAAALFLSGCAKGRAQGDSAAPPQDGAMGRYVETFYEMPQEINRNGGVNWLDDGSLTVISFGEGLYRSEDEGRTWRQEETDWFPMIQGVYCLSAVMGPDGTVAASCSGAMPEAARALCGGEEKEEGNYCVFGMPDGEVKIVDFGFTQEDGSCIETFVFKEDGRLFAGDMRGRVYEVDIEKESLRELFMSERSVGYIDFSGEILMAVGHDRLYRYDLQEEVLLPQDETADAWIRQTIPDGTVAWTGGGYPLAVAGSGEPDVIYLASVDGVYRYVPGGNVMEQVIDGALSVFGDADAVLYRLRILEDREFLAVFQPSTGLVRYTFDSSVPSMPERELRIYSLEENQCVRQAVTGYKRSRPDLYVRYETGLSADGSMTAEDALRRLNTEILAGEGPDVLLLDGLPLDTYIEKGMLQDIRPVLDSLGEALFANVTEGFADGTGAVYAMPMCIRVPLLAADREMIGQMDDLEGIAEQTEKFRAAHPQGGIFGISDAGTMLRLFAMVSSPAWTEEDGQPDEAAVAEFLRQVKRVYDAEQAGAVPEHTERLRREAEELVSYGVDPLQYQMEICNNVLRIPQGYAAAAAGYVEGIQLCLDNVTSVLRTENGLDYRIFSGQAPAPYLPVAMVGIRSKTTRQAEAEEFVRLMFRADTQEKIYDGFPVNRAACEAVFQFDEENSDNGSMTLSVADGTEQELLLYWPDRAEREKFTQYVEELKTPVFAQDYLCGLVCEIGKNVLEGERSAEEGAAEIVKKAAVYLAE